MKTVLLLGLLVASASAGTLNQKQCLKKTCKGTCHVYQVPSGMCLAAQGGEYAMVSCGAGGKSVTTTVYKNSSCKGAGKASTLATDKCVADEAGRFFEWEPCTAEVKHADEDCCLNGDCCHGVEYCCDTCNGTCQCSVNGKCHPTAAVPAWTLALHKADDTVNHRLSKKWLVSKAAGGSDYEDPTANGGSCNAGEEAVRIQNVQGSFCSPSCATAACPTNVPAGTTAQPECCLETPGSSKPGRCALICQASSKCPAKASCKMVQGAIGICTYDSR